MLRIAYSPASRKNVDRERDPYIPRKCAKAVGICPKCHAISRHRRWTIDEEEYRSLVRTAPETARRRCPACRRIADGFPAGVVTLVGGYLRDHRGDILNLVRNEEKRSMGVNPLERILSLEEKKDRIEVATTGEKLAQRIGREIRKACRGTLEYKWSQDAKLLRVSWVREA